jgi:hypothetical protein
VKPESIYKTSKSKAASIPEKAERIPMYEIKKKPKLHGISYRPILLVKSSAENVSRHSSFGHRTSIKTI